MHRIECDKCVEKKRNVHSTGYLRSADAKAGDGMMTLGYFCEDCIEEIFGEYVKLEKDAYIPRSKYE